MDLPVNIANYEDLSLLDDQSFHNKIINNWYHHFNITLNKDVSNFNIFNQSIPSQINHLLETDLESLIHKSMMKSDGSINENNYYDDDFYTYLLNSIIDENSIINNQLYQKKPKIKKDVDTKASKGRKIRFDIHEKLTNFMTSNDNLNDIDQQDWNHLFNNLFGLIKIQNDQELNGENGENVEIDGFKLI